MSAWRVNDWMTSPACSSSRTTRTRKKKNKKSDEQAIATFAYRIGCMS